MAEEYHVENFGCRANRADGEAIDSALRHGGLMPAAGMTVADVVIVNTCSVTAQADRTARAFLRRVRRQNPSARILVTGCYAQRAPEEIAALDGVHAVVGNSHKSLLSELALPEPAAPAGFVSIEALTRTSASWPGPSVYVDREFAHSALAMTPHAVFSQARTGTARNQTRPNFKVQDGCGNRCGFCVIPATRGHSRSMSLEACLRSVQGFVAGGGRELVLSGINLGRWGRDLIPTGTLEQLVGAILSKTSLDRLRLSSIEPMDWTPELLSLFHQHSDPSDSDSPRLARHAHLPLQSGSDAILRAMHRRYRPWHYAEKLDAIRRQMPDAAIGADVMVGFPGESDALFEESLAFIQAQPFTYLHLFPFSPRPGTPAWSLHRHSPVPPRAIEERMASLRRLITVKNLAFRQSFIGRSLTAITLNTPESEYRQGFTRALTDNFLELELQGRFSPNRIERAAISGVRGAGIAGYPAARHPASPDGLSSKLSDAAGATRFDQCYS